MKTYILIAAAFFLGIALIFLSGFVGGTDLSISDEQLVKDVSQKWVVLGPQGQLWGFSSDQKITINQLETRAGNASNRAYVVVNLTAQAAIPPQPEAPKEQNSTQPNNKAAVGADNKPTSVYLKGIAKIHYEKISNNWYLIDIEPVTLLVTR